MKPITTFGLTVVLTSVLAAPGIVAVSGEQAREANAHNQMEPSSQTTTSWSSTMSSANTPSHDGNGQLGTNQRESAEAAGDALQPWQLAVLVPELMGQCRLYLMRSGWCPPSADGHYRCGLRDWRH